MEKKNKIKIIIITLAVLLVLSVAALFSTLIYNYLNRNMQTTVSVPDNLITSEEDVRSNSTTDKDSEISGDNKASEKNETENSDSANTQGAGTNAGTGTANAKQAATLNLYKSQAEDNIPFNVGNMFPGDSKTEYFCVQASYHNKITVHYKATVRSGYEKLAEVLKVRVKLLNTGETMYDGLIQTMPKSVTYSLNSSKSVTDELYYEITAYLDTSVGNEYQNKDLIADFKWWIEGTENLDSSPKTGDYSNIMPWALLAICSGCLMILLLLCRRRKEDEKNG